MVVIAFWTAGQFFIEKQYVLLVFAGIGALMTGIMDFVRAFQIKKLGESSRGFGLALAVLLDRDRRRRGTTDLDARRRIAAEVEELLDLLGSRDRRADR